MNEYFGELTDGRRMVRLLWTVWSGDWRDCSHGGAGLSDSRLFSLETERPPSRHQVAALSLGLVVLLAAAAAVLGML